MTGSGKTGLITTITNIHFLLVRESCTHALPRNTKYLIMDGQVCFYRRLFTDTVKPPGCISWPWRAIIGLHGVPGCSSRQPWPPLWILPSVSHTEGTTLLHAWVQMVAFGFPPSPASPHPPAHPLWNQSVILQALKKPSKKPAAFK